MCRAALPVYQGVALRSVAEAVARGVCDDNRAAAGGGYAAVERVGRSVVGVEGEIDASAGAVVVEIHVAVIVGVDSGAVGIEGICLGVVVVIWHRHR